MTLRSTLGSLVLLVGLAGFTSCPAPGGSAGADAPLPEDYVKVNGKVYEVDKASVQDQAISASNHTYFVKLVASGISLDTQGYVGSGDGAEVDLTFNTKGAPIAGHWVGQLYDSPGLTQIRGTVRSGGLAKNLPEPGFDGGAYDLTVTLAGGVLGVNGTFAFQDFSGEVKFSGPTILYTIP